MNRDQAASLRSTVDEFHGSWSRPSGVHYCRGIVVTGGKGGVGKTNIAVNLSLAMQNAGAKVLLLDADLGLANVDVLLGINGKPVRDMADFTKLVGETNLMGGGAQLDINRQGLRMPVRIMPPGAPPRGIAQGPRPPGLKAQPPARALPGGTIQPPPVVDSRWLGIDAETFPAGEGRAFGIPAGVGGVLIDGVVIGSRGERAGLMANDVIVSVNGRKTDTTVALWSMLAGLDGANWVEFGLFRGGRLITISLPTAAAALVGGFPGRMGGQGLGPAGSLVCPNCGTRLTHQRAVPCFTVPCPSCGTLMTRVR